MARAKATVSARCCSCTSTSTTCSRTRSGGRYSLGDVVMSRGLASLVLAGALWCAGKSFAEAHAFLDRATPAVGSTVHTVPSEVRIQYTEQLEPAYSTAHVEDASGSIVSTAAHVDANERSVLIVPLNRSEERRVGKECRSRWS